mmetsp:Transcript_98285/g.158481  ORF Transcript_98285/g.158481 Transcript_98285/m.158481 type:complete len:217 (+) Transcript_98285:1512-2162(+)
MRAHPTLICLKVECLLKTDGGYPTNAAAFPRIDAPNAPKYRGGWLRQQGESVLQHGGGHALLRVFTQPQNKQTKKHTTNIWKYVLALRVSPHQPPYTHVFLRVDFLLKTDSGYPRDAEVTLFTLANPEHSLRFDTHWSAPPVSALARSWGPGKFLAFFLSLKSRQLRMRHVIHERVLPHMLARRFTHKRVATNISTSRISHRRPTARVRTTSDFQR